MTEIKSQEGFSLSKASTIVFLFSVGAKGLGFLREIVFAARFGTGSGFDLYLTASVIPLILSVSGFYISQNFLIPFFKSSSSSSKGFDQRIALNTIIIYATLLFTVIALPMLVFSPNIVDWYMGGEPNFDKSLAIKIFRIYTFLIIPSTLTSVLSSYLIVNYDFKNSQITQVIPALSVIIAAFFFGPTFGVIVIPIGMLTGILIQILYLFILIKPFSKLEFIKLSAISKSFGVVLFYTIMIEIIGQFYTIIDRSFADKLPAGAISALNYSTNIFSLPITLVTVAISTALLPKFSEDFFNNRRDSLIKNVLTSLSLNNFIILGFCFAFIFFGDSIVSILYQRGKFDITGTAITGQVLFYQTLGLLFYALYAPLNILCYSMGKAKFLFFLTLFAIPFKWLMNSLLVSSMAQNGLALATSLTFTLFFVSALLYVSVYLRYNFFNAIIKDISIAGSLFLSGYLFLLLFQSSLNLTGVSNILSLFLFVLISAYLTYEFKIQPGDEIISRVLNGMRTKIGNRIK